MNFDLIRKVKDTENKSEAEYELLRYHGVISVISELLVQESKAHMTSEETVLAIRACLNENL